VTRSVTTSEQGAVHLPLLVQQKPQTARRRHAFQSDAQHMYIVASVDEQPVPEGQWAGKEIVLFAIRADADGRIVVRVRFALLCDD